MINKYGEQEIIKGINKTVDDQTDDGKSPYYPDFTSVTYKFKIPFQVN